MTHKREPASVEILDSFSWGSKYRPGRPGTQFKSRFLGHDVIRWLPDDRWQTIAFGTTIEAAEAAMRLLR